MVYFILHIKASCKGSYYGVHSTFGNIKFGELQFITNWQAFSLSNGVILSVRTLID